MTQEEDIYKTQAKEKLFEKEILIRVYSCKIKQQ